MSWRGIQLTEKELEELNKKEKEIKQEPLKIRIRTIKLKNQGYKGQEIQGILGVSYQTISLWIKWYNEGGIQKLLEWKKKGGMGKQKLTETQKEKMKEKVKTEPFNTAKEAVEWVKNNFDIVYSISRMQYILKKKLSMSFKLPIKKPGKVPDEEIQLNFIEEYKEICEESIRNGTHVLFHDPTHQLHNTILSRCWQLIGGKNTIELPSNTGRNRYTLIASINPITYDYFSLNITGMCNADETIKAFEEIRKFYDKKDGGYRKEIIIILDNARYQRAYKVQDKAKELGITLKFLPRYSPNLNLIERVHKFLKKILANKFFPTFKDFCDNIDDFSNNFHKFIYDIKNLISQKFQIFKNV